MTVPLVRKLLLLCALVLAAIVMIPVLAGWRWSPPAATPVDEALLQAPVLEHGGLDVALLGETVARPLFMPTRRPPPPEALAAQPEVEADPFASVQVLGLFGSGAGGGAILLIDGQPQRVLYGQKAGPWVLRSVHGRKAEFIRDDGSSTALELVHLPQPDAPPPPHALDIPAAPAAQDVPVAAEASESEQPAVPEVAAPARATSAAARALARAARRQAAQLSGPTTQ